MDASVSDDTNTNKNEAIGRGNAYLASGTDCAFLPGFTQLAGIEPFVKIIDMSIKILASSVRPSL